MNNKMLTLTARARRMRLPVALRAVEGPLRAASAVTSEAKRCAAACARGADPRQFFFTEIFMHVSGGSLLRVARGCASLHRPILRTKNIFQHMPYNARAGASWRICSQRALHDNQDTGQ
jgi:hypothetical protein